MSAIYELSAEHRRVLEWFEANAGRTFAKRPIDVGLPIKVASEYKGIWKPAGMPYAVSVVQTRKGIYADLDPIPNASEGTWTYFYHQQGNTAEDLQDPTRHFANVALFQCSADDVPVGVVIPGKDGKGYEVLGLAYVQEWARGYFKLVGPVSLGIQGVAGVAEASASIATALIGLPAAAFDPNADQDNRVTVLREVTRRQGGPRFRRALLRAYEGRCAMTAYDAPPALEAAHIVPYRGPQTNHIVNGLLLRADMHDLFDLGLVAVDTSSMRLRLARELAGTKYEQFEGRELWLPRDSAVRPNIEALEMHRSQSAVG